MTFFYILFPKREKEKRSWRTAKKEKMGVKDIIIAILTLLAGIGIFLVACSMLSSNLESVGSNRLRNLFSKASGSNLLGVGIGAVGTAAIQSSGATTVMVIGFVNAAIMSLKQAASIIYGANIGTTITGQIVALGLLGSDAISTTVIFSAFAGIGAFITTFTKKDTIKKIGGIIAGFGMLFVGLNGSARAVVLKQINEQKSGGKTSQLLLVVMDNQDEAQYMYADLKNLSGMKDAETEKGLKATTVALDGIAIIVNEKAPVDDLSVEEIASIFTGAVTDWASFGGSGEIACIGREAGSGTRDGFESITHTTDKCVLKQELTSTGAVIAAVQSSPNAIGYASFASVEGQSGIKVLTVDGIPCTAENILNGSYVIQRPFNLVTKEGTTLSPAAQAFFDYMISKDAADLVTKAGAVPTAK